MDKKYFKLVFGGVALFIFFIYMIYFSMHGLQTKREEKEIVSSTSKVPREVIEEIPKEASEKSFTIQVASFQDKAKTEKLAEELKEKGYQAFV